MNRAGRVLRSFTASAAGSAAFALLVIVAAGCGDSSGEVFIHGHISYRGEAINNGVLTFFPARGRPISATLTRDGAYTSRLPPGQYRVIVTVGVNLPTGWKEGDPIPEPKFVLPAQYTSRSETSLRKTVSESQKAPIDFVLE